MEDERARAKERKCKTLEFFCQTNKWSPTPGSCFVRLLGSDRKNFLLERRLLVILTAWLRARPYVIREILGERRQVNSDASWVLEGMKANSSAGLNGRRNFYSGGRRASGAVPVRQG